MTAITGEAVAFGLTGAIILASALAATMVKRTFHSVMFLGLVLVGVGALFVVLGSPLVGVIQILVYVGGILTLFVFAVMFVAGDEKETDPVAVKGRSGAWKVLAAVFLVLAALYVASMLMGPVSGKVSAWLAGALGAWAAFAGFVAALLVLAAALVAAMVAWMGARHILAAWSGVRILGVGVSAVILALLVGITFATAPWASPAAEAGQGAANDLAKVTDAMFGPQVVGLEVLGVLLTAVMIGALVIARPLTAPEDAQRYLHVSRQELAESQEASSARRKEAAE